MKGNVNLMNMVRLLSACNSLTTDKIRAMRRAFFMLSKIRILITPLHGCRWCWLYTV